MFTEAGKQFPFGFIILILKEGGDFMNLQKQKCIYLISVGAHCHELYPNRQLKRDGNDIKACILDITV